MAMIKGIKGVRVNWFWFFIRKVD